MNVTDMRVGEGWDVHALVPGRRLVIGGVEIPHTAGLLGHSDADVLLHAVSAAIGFYYGFIEQPGLLELGNGSKTQQNT